MTPGWWPYVRWLFVAAVTVLAFLGLFVLADMSPTLATVVGIALVLGLGFRAMELDDARHEARRLRQEVERLRRS